MISKRTPPETDRASTSFTRGGTTLLELLVVMSIVSVLAGLGYVSLPRDRFAAREVARVLAADMNRARSEAIRLNTNLALQFGGTACAGADYCLYADEDRDLVPDSGELAILRRTIGSDFPSVGMSTTGFGNDGTVWFDVRGLPRSSSGAYLGGTATATVRPRGADAGFFVTLEPQGRIQVTNE